jgi:hypothetical protein
VLLVGLRCTAGAADSVVETPQLALCAGVHVTHAGNDRVRLIVEIKTVADQFFEIDFSRTFETAVARSTITAAIGAIVTKTAALAFTTSATGTAARPATLPARRAGPPVICRLGLLFRCLVRLLLVLRHF